MKRISHRIHFAFRFIRGNGELRLLFSRENNTQMKHCQAMLLHLNSENQMNLKG